MKIFKIEDVNVKRAHWSFLDHFSKIPISKNYHKTDPDSGTSFTSYPDDKPDRPPIERFGCDESLTRVAFKGGRLLNRVFQNKLFECVFESVTFENVQFLQLSFETVVFRNCVFENCTFASESEFDTCLFVNCKFKSSEFGSSSSPMHSLLLKTDFVTCSFQDTVFNRANFSWNEFSGNTLQDCKFVGCKFHESTFHQNKIFRSTFTTCFFLRSQIMEGNIFSGVVFDPQRGESMTHFAVFDSCVVYGVFRRCVFNDIIFQNCEISSCCIGNGGAETFTHCSFENVVWKECRIRHARFFSCVIAESDMDGTNCVDNAYFDKRCAMENFCFKPDILYSASGLFQSASPKNRIVKGLVGSRVIRRPVTKGPLPSYTNRHVLTFPNLLKPFSTIPYYCYQLYELILINCTALEGLCISFRVVAGCRDFSEVDAIRHWTHRDYEPADRGLKYVAEILTYAEERGVRDKIEAEFFKAYGLTVGNAVEGAVKRALKFAYNRVCENDDMFSWYDAKDRVKTGRNCKCHNCKYVSSLQKFKYVPADPDKMSLLVNF